MHLSYIDMMQGSLSLPIDKIIHWVTLKASEDHSVNVAKQMIFVTDEIESILGKGENTSNQHFSFPTMFSKIFYLRVFILQNCMVKG